MLEAPEAPPIRPYRFRLGAVAVSLGLVAGFVAVRGMIYALMPAWSALEWNVRDTVMDVPRAAFGFFAWRYGRRLWKNDELGFHWRKWRECLVVGALFCLVLAPRPLLLKLQPLDWSWLPVLTLSSFVVGFFEEILFRSVLLRALFDLSGARLAFWGSATLFTLFHVQAQPLHSWPGIFVFGLLFAALRLNGVGIWPLAIAHAFYDSAVLTVYPIDDFPSFWRLSEFLYVAYLTAMYVIAYRIGLRKPGKF